MLTIETMAFCDFVQSVLVMIKTGFFYYRLADTSFLPVIERLHRLMTRWVKVINAPATLAMLAPVCGHCTGRTVLTGCTSPQ